MRAARVPELEHGRSGYKDVCCTDGLPTTPKAALMISRLSPRHTAWAEPQAADGSSPARCGPRFATQAGVDTGFVAGKATDSREAVTVVGNTRWRSPGRPVAERRAGQLIRGEREALSTLGTGMPHTDTGGAHRRRKGTVRRRVRPLTAPLSAANRGRANRCCLPCAQGPRRTSRLADRDVPEH